MKYCKNCGMLLEDSIESCIKCGTDVSAPANVSMYPPEVEARMKQEKAEKKSKSTMIAVLIGIFVALAILVGAMVWKISTSSPKLPAKEEETLEVAVEEEPVAAEVIETEEEEPVVDKDVKDDAGSYYCCVPLTDAAGNHVFNAVYPEDISQMSFMVDGERYSEQFPQVINFVANDEANSIRFIYTSPQQLWYKNSEKGHSRSNERDPQYYMSFFKFEDAKSYIDALVKQSYPKARKIEMTSQTAVSDALTQAISGLSKQRQDFFLNEKIGDYAHLGADAEYATMGSTCEAQIFEYQITDSNKEVMYCKYYVPVISNDLYYSTETGGDMGTITEWYVLCVCGLETGNDFAYEDYQKAFDIFCANAVPTREFFYLNACNQDEIKKAIAADTDPAPLAEDKLKEFGNKYKSDSPIGDLNESIFSFLGSYGSKSFASDDMLIYAPDDVAIAYFNQEDGKLFVSPDDSEYPGAKYTELILSSSDSASE